jgi:hypothetical protein
LPTLAIDEPSFQPLRHCQAAPPPAEFIITHIMPLSPLIIAATLAARLFAISAIEATQMLIFRYFSRFRLAERH